ncbi:MAG: long-chain-fatty-acid--CoA ligase [Deltaproteobacteria bacterium]|nr:long-chain-fatty-acid--CoA ligase [Deltaproteobacteria bacterium]
MRSLLDQVRHWVVKEPQKFMVYDEDRKFTYEQIYDRARRFSGGLRKLGVGKKARIGVIMFNSYRWYDLYYGLSAAGCILVPLNFRLANPEILYQINDSGCKVLIFDPEFTNVVQGIKSSLKTVEHFVYTGETSPFDEAIPYDSLLDAEPFEENITPDNVFGIYYTGGTTGLAKGVMLSHKNILANALNFATDVHFGADHVQLSAAPMFHLADGAMNFTITLTGGAHASIKAFEPVAVFQAIEKFKCTTALLVPTMINMLNNHPDATKYDLSSLRLIVYGASPIAPDVLQKAIDLFQCDFCQLYGMTEAGPILTVLQPEDHKVDPDNPESVKLLRSCGREVTGVQLRVVDKDGNDAKPGEAGEIWARGDNIMMGYWGKPIETEEVLHEDGWYETRDIAQMDENNYLYVVDRSKDMIISGAENIYTVEVENAVYKHPAVLEAAVIGVPDDRWGEVVKACVVLKQGMPVTESELIEFCRQHIASYKCPKSVDFMGSIPKSGAGKILKRELREMYWKEHERRVG